MLAHLHVKNLALIDEFEVDYETAKEDVMGFLSTLKTVGMIDYEE